MPQSKIGAYIMVKCWIEDLDLGKLYTFKQISVPPLMIDDAQNWSPEIAHYHLTPICTIVNLLIRMFLIATSALSS